MRIIRHSLTGVTLTGTLALTSTIALAHGGGGGYGVCSFCTEASWAPRPFTRQGEWCIRSDRPDEAIRLQSRSGLWRQPPFLRLLDRELLTAMKSYRIDRVR